MRVRQSIFTFASVSVFSIVSTLIGLIATPYLLRWLGDERFGAFRALSEWMGYAILLELGLTGATLTVLARAQADGPGAVAAATRVCIRAFARVAVGMFLAGIVFCLLSPMLVPVSDIFREDLRWAAGILACSALLVPLGPFRSLLESAQRGYVVNILLIASSVTLTTLAMVFAYHGGGISGQAIATVAAATLFAGCSALYCWNHWLRGRNIEDGGKWSELLWKSNWQTVVLDISGRLAVLSDTIIIGLFLGPIMVTPFVLTQRLIQVGSAQVLAIGNSSWAGLASLFHSGQHELLRQRLVELSRLSAVLSGMVIIPLTAYNHAFMRLWVGERAYAGDGFTILAGVVGLCAGWWSLWGWVFRGAGILRPLVPTSIASTAVNVAVSITCTAGLGWIEGPLIGTVGGFVGVTAWRHPLMFKQYLGLPPARLAGALAPVVLVFAAGGALAWWVARTWPPQTWFSLILAVLATSVSYAVVVVTVLLTREERQLWRQRVMIVLRASNS